MQHHAFRPSLCYDARPLEAPTLFVPFCIAAFVLIIVAMRSGQASRQLGRRIEQLEDEVRALRAMVESGAARSEVAPAATPEAPLEPMAATAIAPALEPAELPLPLDASAAALPVAEEAPHPPRTPNELLSRIEWERLFGVRAAAVLGGIALALAGLLFFKYSIEHGLIPPWLRVALGTIVGIGCVAASEWSLRRNYSGTADALAGAGVVVLYAAFWASSALYDLVPLAASFVLMIAVTATCCTLAARHASLVIALLGLVGGFATPLLLSSGADRPIGLFGYVLLLDLALLILAQHRRWPALAVLSLIGTVFYQASWMIEHMDPARLDLGLSILALFAVVFALAGRLGSDEEHTHWRLTQAAAVLVPFAFVLYFAADADFGPHLHAPAALIALLCLAASWLARVQGPPQLGLGAAAASLAVVTVWVLVRGTTSVPPWEVALWACAIALAFHLFVEREPAAAQRDGPAPPAILSAAGFFLLLIAAAGQGDELWPCLAGWAGLAALLIRHAGFPGRAYLHIVAALAVAFGFSEVYQAQQAAPWFPPLASYLALLIASSIAFQAVALLPRTPPAQRYAAHAAALLPVMLLVLFVPAPDAPPLPFLLDALVLGLLAALAATRLALGGWLLAALGATALVHYDWTFVQLVTDDSLVATTATGVGTIEDAALAIQFAAVLLFTAWPFLTAARFRADRFAWPAAALAGPAWFLALKLLFERRFGSSAIGLLPLGLGAVALLALLRARQVWPRDDARRSAVLAWFAAVALGFATVAIPLQLEHEWLTIGWALEGFALLVLWTRLDHPGLKYVALALLGAVAVRLVANPAVLGYYPRPAWRIINWLLYTYMVPAATLLAASRVLGRHELERARGWERAYLYRTAQPWGALAAGFAGLVVIFVWLNLAIADWFATGETLAVSFARLPARDLSTSIAWAIYALVLLTLGVARRSIALRWVSLGLLLVTIAKVFLHDLGELRDLYRVASLLGLAVSLILVSLGYQRFVFRDQPLEKS